MSKLQEDRRIDPRIKAAMAAFPSMSQSDVRSRDELLAEVNRPEAIAQREQMTKIFDLMDSEQIASKKGLSVATHEFRSSPDGNTIKLALIRPEAREPLACVYYIHGGGMQMMSCFDGMYRAWGRRIAANGVVVVMVDFRNCEIASSVPEVAPFPAGLNDCVSGLRWTVANADRLGVEASRVIVAGESGGGNLTLATAMKLRRDGEIGLVAGLYALCPYISGEWPHPDFPSSVENEGILLSLHHNQGRMGYGIEAFERQDPLAWPSFATVGDVAGFPPTVISVNECDPLRDEGIEFYRLLLRAGVRARGKVVLGTSHGIEILGLACPEISADAAREIAAFARS
jgi:acetyl esterase/lipase